MKRCLKLQTDDREMMTERLRLTEELIKEHDLVLISDAASLPPLSDDAVTGGGPWSVLLSNEIARIIQNYSGSLGEENNASS